MSNKIVISNHPPLEEITIKTRNIEIIALPFKIIGLKDNEGRTVTLKYCKNFQQKNNFTNQC